MCCGQKRAALKNSANTQPVRPQPVPPRPPAFAYPDTPAAGASASSTSGSVRLLYTERSLIRVRGAATGKEYEFSGAAPVQTIDRVDAAALLATRFFSPLFSHVRRRRIAAGWKGVPKTRY